MTAVVLDTEPHAESKSQVTVPRQADSAVNMARQRELEEALAAKERAHQLQVAELQKMAKELTERLERRDAALDDNERVAEELEDELKALTTQKAELEVCVRMFICVVIKVYAEGIQWRDFESVPV